MHNPLSRYKLILKRWAWMIILGVVVCGVITYAAGKLIRPTYQASSTLILNVCTAQSSAYDCTTAGLEALSTYSQLITTPAVLNPVVAKHPGLTLASLTAMTTVKAQSNTLLINLDVNNSNPVLAAQLANEVGQSFAQYSNTQLPGTVQVIPAQVPINPIGLKASYAGAIGALVGLGLSLALIVIFEWIDDRLTSAEEAQELLGADVLAVIPHLTRKQLDDMPELTPGLAEGCRILCASLNAAQHIKPFKLVMVTSAVADEGKSMVAENLATFMAMSGKRVLLVDADMRSHVLNKYFQLNNIHGLSYVLQEEWSEADDELDVQSTRIPTLQVLTAGVSPANPAELLQSPTAVQLFEHLKQTEDYDYIVVDTPPLLPIADAQVLASYVQATILVVDASKTPRKALVRARQSLKRMRMTVLGVVINKSPWPDYSDTHMYRSELYRQQAKQTRANKENVLVEPPETPQPKVLNGAAEGEVDEKTITIPRLSNSLHSND